MTATDDTLILVLDPEAEALAAAVIDTFREHHDPPLPRLVAAQTLDALPDAARAARILLAPPDLAAAAVAELPALRWVQSTWAGVTPIVAALATRRQVCLTAAKGIFGPRMAEYVFGWITAIERRLLDYHDLTRARRWQRLPARDVAGRTLLLLGTGSIGSHLAAVGNAFGLRVLGISRSGRPVPGIERVGTPQELHALLAEADYVVASLPETSASRHLLDAAAIAAMREDAILVNVGRGGTVDDDALVAALRRGHLRAAVLDVFDVEPLPAEHPFWGAPRLYLTPHVAAFTPREGLVRLFADNLARHFAGEPLIGQVDLDAGY